MPVAMATSGEAGDTGRRSIDRQDRSIQRNNSLIAAVGAALLCALASPSSLAQQRAGLDRPDPGIGDGFATAFADQFKTAFGVNDAEARCLVYEVMTDLRATGKYDSTPVDIARKVASRCALVLKAPR
jgi:hypothetical protein